MSYQPQGVCYNDSAYERTCYEEVPPLRCPAESYTGGDRYASRPYGETYERRTEDVDSFRGQEKTFQRNEHLGEVGAVAAGAFGLYEGHKAKTDVEHAGRHKTEAELAGVAALGSAGYAVYEHHEKKKLDW